MDRRSNRWTEQTVRQQSQNFNLLLVTLVVRVPIRTKLIRTVYRLGSWRAGFSSDRNRLRDPSSGLYRWIVNHQSRLGRVLRITLNSTRISGFRVFFWIHVEFWDFGLTRSGKLHRFFLNTKRKMSQFFNVPFAWVKSVFCFPTSTTESISQQLFNWIWSMIKLIQTDRSPESADSFLSCRFLYC